MFGFSLTFKHKCAINQQLCVVQLLKGSSESIGCFSVRVLDCSTQRQRAERGVNGICRIMQAVGELSVALLLARHEKQGSLEPEEQG